MAFPISGTLTTDQVEKLNTISNDAKNTERQKSQTLDKDAFLKLMTVQLQHQDPLSPMDNSEYINQMASFSSVEQLANISTAMTSSTNLDQTMIEQFKEMTLLLRTIASDKTDTTDETETSQAKIIEQNQQIIDQLTKLNSAFSLYTNSNSSSSEDILASLQA